MAARSVENITYEAQRIIQPIYTGGDVSLDSKGQILAACLGEDAVLTNLKSGRTLCRVQGDGEVLTALRVTPDGSHLIVCSRSLSLRIYALDRLDSSDELLQPRLVRTLKPHSTPVVTATIDTSSALLATGSADGVIKIWDIRDGYLTHTFRGHTGLISALHFFDLPAELVVSAERNKQKTRTVNGSSETSGGQSIENQSMTSSISLRLASGGEDGNIRIWDLVKKKAVASLESHVSVVRALSFSTEHATLLSASRDKTLTTWDPKAWRVRKTIPVLEAIESAGFIGNSSYAFTGGEHGVLRIWETETGREITKEQAVKPESEGIVQVMEVIQGHSLMTVHIDNSLKIYSTEQLNDSASLEDFETLEVERQLSGSHDEVIDMAFVGLKKNVLALATNSESIRLISIDLEEEQSTDAPYFGADIGQLDGHEDIVICLDVDWSGCWLVTGAKDNSARLWQFNQRTSSFDCHAIFTGHAESLGAVALPSQAPTETSAAHQSPLDHPPTFLLTGSQDKTIKRWNITSHASLKGSRAFYTKKAHDKDINAIAINYNSTLFASASQDRTVKIWSVDEGEVQGVLRGHKRGVWSVQFAPKNTPSVSGDSGAASSGRGLIVTGSGDKTVRIWSLSDYNCIRTFEGHTNTVLKVIWIPQGDSTDDTSKQQQQQYALAASAASDGLVKIWDCATGECAATLDNHTDRVWSLAVSAKTGHLVSGGADSVITFWANTTAATVAATAAESTARVEQEQEMMNHVHSGNYREAITLALQLNHPARLLALFSTVINTHPPESNSLTGLVAVDDVIVSLSDEQLYRLLLRIRDWNTNAKTAHIAQRLLWVITKRYPISRLVELRKQGRGIADVLEAMQAYTDRHYKRCEELIEESYLVDFVVRGMEEGGFIAEDHSSSRPGANGINGDADGDVIMVG